MVEGIHSVIPECCVIVTFRESIEVADTGK